MIVRIRYGLLAILLLTELAHGKCIPWSEQMQSGKDELVVGSIEIEAGNVFDPRNPKERGLIHRTSNAFHKVTASSVIRRQLVFKSGDVFDFEKLLESERLLRKNRYITRAVAIPVERCGNAVNVRVVTSDSWSLVSGFSFGRAGGVNKSSLDFREGNLFGRGKLVEFKFKKGIERDANLFRYVDPQLFGTRKKLKLQLQDNSDGNVKHFHLSKPFYSLESKSAWNVILDDSVRQEPLYLNGEINREITIDQQSLDINFGRRVSFTDRTLQRIIAGWTLSTNTFDPTSGFADNIEILDRNYSMPYLEFSWMKERYVQKTNYRTMGSIEDVTLGTGLNTRLGFSSKAFGASDNLLVYKTQLKHTRQIGKSTLGLFSIIYSGELGRSINNNAILEASAEWFITQSNRRKLYFSTHMALGDNLYADRQLVLGGDTGLRGYPLRFQSGDNVLRVSAEQRWYFDYYPWRVAKLGAAVFADAGTAWGETGNDLKIISNLGLGLRLIPTRQSSGKIMHLDIAFPLDQANEISSVQILLKTRKEF